jgi:chorismate mutase/prephenate dehydratase
VDDPDLARHRADIDDLDRQLVELLSRRARAAQAIGAAKKATGAAIFAPHREHAIYERIAGLNDGPLPSSALRAIWREIMSGCIALERSISVCYLGTSGSFTHTAARLKFGDSVSYAPVESISTVFTEVERGHADYGVVPIENSTDGGINDTIDAFLSTSLVIVGELRLRVRHHLMARGERSAIRRVYSKDTAFRQCRSWLAANLPGVALIELGSTTQAAERAAAEPDAAAIGSEEAAAAMGLPLVASSIEDNPSNTTRFVVVAGPDKAAKPTGSDRTSVMFGIQDRPGALYDALLPFRQAGLSLSRIESRPSRRQVWEYLFFIDCLGHRDDPAVSQALQALSGISSVLQVLGSYPRSEQALNG